MKQAIIFFTKIPEYGQTKTRLQNFLSKEEIVKLHSKLIANNFEVIKEIDADKFISVSPLSSFFILEEIIGEHAGHVFQQSQDDDLGMRMYKAFDDVFSKGYDRVVLVGSDLVGLTARALQDSFNRLKTHDVVIIPTRDGGYGVMGLNRPLQEALLNITYSCETVVQQIQEQVIQAGYTVKLLDTIADIDYREDIIQYELNDDSAQFYAQGEYNANFVFENHTKLFRYALGSQMNLDNQIEYEYLTLKSLESTGVTPKVYKIEYQPKLLDKPYLIEEFLPGKPLDYRQDLPIAAYILSKIHQVDVQKFEHLIVAQAPLATMMEECLQMFQHYIDWSDRDDRVVALLQELLEQANQFDLYRPLSNPCVINTELNSGNFLINGQDPQRAYLIDWEKPLIGEKEQDIGHFLAPTTTLWKTDVLLTPEQMTAFVQEYNKYSDVKIHSEFLNQYIQLNILRGLTWSAMAYREYCQAEKTSMHAETFNKIKMYLTPEFIQKMQTYFN